MAGRYKNAVDRGIASHAVRMQRMSRAAYMDAECLREYYPSQKHKIIQKQQWHRIHSAQARQSLFKLAGEKP